MNNWLYERSRILAKYTDKYPSKRDNVQLRFDYPDCGWINMHVLVDGEEKDVVDLSSVYEPFEPLKKWLEGIVNSVETFEYSPCVVVIDCELYKVSLHFEPIIFGWDNWDGKGLHPSYCGLFYLYDEADNRIMAEGYCETDVFVRNVYLSIIQYAKEMMKEDGFVEDWISYAYASEVCELDEHSEELKNFFLNLVKSEIIEHYINYGTEK